MLTLGWFEEVTRGSNWKFRFDWRARFRMASVSGTSSMTINGTVSSTFAARVVLVPAAFSRAATCVGSPAGAPGVVAGAWTAGGAESVAGDTAGVLSAGLLAGGLLSWAKLTRPLVARPMSSAVSFVFINVVLLWLDER